MSLNCEEIDLILNEAPLVGMKIQNVYQPTFDSLVLELFGKGILTQYYFSIAHNACRLHPLSTPAPKNERPLRFMECLRSRIRGGTILHAAQISKDRIVKIDIIRANEKGVAERSYLYARLWSGAGNIILVSVEGIIIDALRRLPARNEVSGAAFVLPQQLDSNKQPSKHYVVRDLEGKGTFWQKIEQFYAQNADNLSRSTLLTQAHDRYERKKISIETKLNHLVSKQQEYEQAERFRQLGDILLAGYCPEIQGRKAFARVYDYYENKEILIEIDQNLNPAKNAAIYYEKYRKAKSGLEEIRSEIQYWEKSLNHLDAWLNRLEKETNHLIIAKILRKGGAARSKEKPAFPCQYLDFRGWRILIGRSGKENEDILRHIVRGSDLWLHARDYAGSYVFIKAKKNKSIPPEVLLAAAKLAIYYSKARKNGGGDVHTAFVKNLRKAKEGPIGRVIPYFEKNLYITFTEAEIKEIFQEYQSKEENYV